MATQTQNRTVTTFQGPLTAAQEALRQVDSAARYIPKSATYAIGMVRDFRAPIVAKIKGEDPDWLKRYAEERKAAAEQALRKAMENQQAKLQALSAEDFTEDDLS